jgi:hypothetical protein
VRISGTAAVALLLLLTMAGCSGSTGGTAGPTSASGSVATSGSASPGATSSPGPTGSPGAPPVAAALVQFGRQGGIAGVDDELIVWPDGSYQVSHAGKEPTKGQLTPADLNRLQQVLDASHFDDIPAVNPGRAVADGFTYRVGYRGHEVLAADGGVPAALSPVLAVLGEFASR